MNRRSKKKVEFQVKEQVSVQVDVQACGLVQKEAAGAAAAQMDDQSVPDKTNTHRVTPTRCVPDKSLGRKPTSDELCSQSNKQATASVLRQPGREVEMNGNKQHRATVKVPDQMVTEWTEADTKVKPREAGMANGAIKCEGSAWMSSQPAAEVSRQTLSVSTAERKAPGASQVEHIRPSLKPLLMGRSSPPIIALQPHDAGDRLSCDEVQSMEVR